MDALDSAEINHQIDGFVEIMLDAIQNAGQPLTKERLFSWHTLLFPVGKRRKMRISSWRTTFVDIVSCPLGKEIVHFEGPPHESVEREMDLFFHW